LNIVTSIQAKGKAAKAQKAASTPKLTTLPAAFCPRTSTPACKFVPRSPPLGVLSQLSGAPG